MIKAKLFKNGHKGFTLIEVLVVLAILAVLAGLAIPVYTAQVDKAKGQEAYMTLASTRESLLRYASANNGSFTGATLGNGTTNGTIDFNPNKPGGGQKAYFKYDFVGTPGATVTVKATLLTAATTDPQSGTPTNSGNDWVSISNDGTPGKSGIFN